MKDNLTRYMIAIEDANEIINVFLDMDGGRWVLTIIHELIQELLTSGNVSGAVMAVLKLYETADLPCKWASEGELDLTWISLLIGAIKDILENES